MNRYFDRDAIKDMWDAIETSKNEERNELYFDFHPIHQSVEPTIEDEFATDYI